MINKIKSITRYIATRWLLFVAIPARIITSKNKKIKILKDRVSDMATTIEALRSIVADKKKVIYQYSKKIQAQRKEINRLRNKIHDLKAKQKQNDLSCCIDACNKEYERLNIKA